MSVMNIEPLARFAFVCITASTSVSPADIIYVSGWFIKLSLDHYVVKRGDGDDDNRIARARTLKGILGTHFAIAKY